MLTRSQSEPLLHVLDVFPWNFSDVVVVSSASNSTRSLSSPNASLADGVFESKFPYWRAGSSDPTLPGLQEFTLSDEDDTHHPITSFLDRLCS
ncbi:MAG: hypothetical protein ACK56I_24730, partial [bacterium]